MLLTGMFEFTVIAHRHENLGSVFPMGKYALFVHAQIA